MRKTVIYPMVAIVGLLGSVGSVFAHAHIGSTNPYDGETLQSSPAEIAVHFGSVIEGSLAMIAVTTDANQDIELGPVRISTDAKALIANPAKKLEPDVYKVRWKALSHDGHPVSGQFSFTVSK